VDKPHDQVIKEVIQVVRDNIGPVASFKMAAVVKKLPKTRAGKIPRNTIAAMAAGKEFQVKSIIISKYSSVLWMIFMVQN
jgi:propionyl-CoA synthetase